MLSNIQANNPNYWQNQIMTELGDFCSLGLYALLGSVVGKLVFSDHTTSYKNVVIYAVKLGTLVYATKKITGLACRMCTPCSRMCLSCKRICRFPCLQQRQDRIEVAVMHNYSSNYLGGNGIEAFDDDHDD